jgi:hypothetical protein
MSVSDLIKNSPLGNTDYQLCFPFLYYFITSDLPRMNTLE